MSMFTHVDGIREKTTEVIKKRKAVEALVQAGVQVPKELISFFGDMNPEAIVQDDAAGLKVEIPHALGQDDSSSWIEVSVKDIPRGIERIRFTNSW